MPVTGRFLRINPTQHLVVGSILAFPSSNALGTMSRDPYRLSKTPNHIWKAGPCLGEDNEYVYKEILGYFDDEVAQMLADGVITTEADAPTVQGLYLSRVSTGC